MLKIKDLKKGEIYYGSWENGDKRCIFKQGVAAINSLDQFDNYSKECCTSSIVTLRESTLGEKHWLNECIKANKFISYEEAMKTFTQKFETGKWYKLGEWISKFSHLKNNEFWGENICIKDNYRDPLGWLDLDAYTPKLITNLEEIQQYLPANHPDKVSNSLIGRYLKALINAPFGIGRANKGDYFIILDDLTECKLVKDSSTWAYKEKNEKINPEVWELMPVGFNPNQVDSVPEYVECTNWGGTTFITGRIYKRRENGRIYGANNVELHLNEKSYFKPSTKEAFEAQNKTIIQQKPMETNNEFKVGEYVITKGYSTYYDGRVLKITKISNGYYYFEILDNGYYNKTHNFDDRCILRRAKLEEIPTKDLSNEELLSIAKTYYPIGTKFQPIYGGKISSIVEENNHLFGKSSSGDVIVVTTDNGDGQMLKNSTAIWSKEKGFAKIISSPNEIKGIKPSDEIEIGDEVECNHGKGIVLAISEIGNYLVNGKSNGGHTGCGGKLKKGKISDKYDSWYYNLNELKLIRKANNNTTIFEQTGIFPVEEIKKGERETSNEITIPKIVKMKSIVDFKLENSKLVNINVPIYTKPKKQVKSIKIEKFELSI